MPRPFKIGARRADAVTVSDTVVNETTHGLLPDGDAPRLGGASAPMLPNVPHPSVFADAGSVPALPVVSPVLTDGESPTMPTTAPTLPTPTLPSPAAHSIAEAAYAVALEEADKVEERRHPMAHLMPEKIKPSEASLRAAEARAAKKKKARRIKIVVAVCVVAVTAVVGPPLAKWTINAVNQAGSVSKDEPAEQPVTGIDDDPQATPSAGLQAIVDAEQLVSGTTTPDAP